MDVCNAFNNYYGTVADTLLSNRTNRPNDMDFMAYCHGTSLDSMFSSRPTVCIQEVVVEICKLNNCESLGPNGLGPKIIKDILHIIIEPLTYIYNLSFKVGIVPDEFKRAKIIPIHKKVD